MGDVGEVMLRYICLSDLHAGALTSLLDDRPRPDDGISVVTRAFGHAITGFLQAAGDPKPQLILLGDALDLQFSKRSHATRSGLGFLRSLAETGGFADRVIATAGNHDHAIWSDARLAIHADAFHQEPGGTRIDDREATPAFSETPAAHSRLLDALIKEAGFSGGVDLRYPNIGLTNDARSVVLHHGHFAESVYRLMTQLRETLFGAPDRDLTVDRLSAENAGWIDFAWSSFGDAAGLGRETELLYQNFLTSTGFRRLTAGWSNVAADMLTEKLPMPGRRETRDAVGILTKVGMDVTLGKFRDVERYAEVEALTSDGLAGLHWYLNGPTLRQIETERGHLPDDLTFVFGHTHKPFSCHIHAAGYPSPLKVYNTGGWTLNGPRLDNAEGAALLLMDDALHAVAIRLFNTPRNGKVARAHVEVLSDHPDAKTFAGQVQDWIDAAPSDWDALARAAELAYHDRQEFLLSLTSGEPQTELRAAR